MQFMYTSSFIYFTSYVKLGEIGIGRNKWLFAEVYGGQEQSFRADHRLQGT